MSDVEFIFGGSFDPIHFGHLHIIDSLQSLNADWPIRILPCSVPALKKQTSASFEQRVEMIRLALKGYKLVTVDQREGSRIGKSYSYDTLRELRNEFPNRRLVMVIGSDNLDSIGQWYQAEQLASYCHLIVVNRPDSSVEQQQAQLINLGFESAKSYKQLAEAPCGLFFYYKIIEMNTSSTEIRESLSHYRAKTTTGKKTAVGKKTAAGKKTTSQFNVNGLVEHSQDIALAASGEDLAGAGTDFASSENEFVKSQNSTSTRKVDVFKIDTPKAVKDYIKDNSIY